MRGRDQPQLPGWLVHCMVPPLPFPVWMREDGDTAVMIRKMGDTAVRIRKIGDTAVRIRKIGATSVGIR